MVESEKARGKKSKGGTVVSNPDESFGVEAENEVI